MKNYCKYILLLIIPFALGMEACNRFLDVVPDKVATIDESFKTKEKAKVYLYTLYSYLPEFNSVRGSNVNPGLMGGHEVWFSQYGNFDNYPGVYIARGLQNTSNPYFNAWQGQNRSADLYQGIRKCNIFLKNIHEVVNIEEYKRAQWKAEAKVLKAYFYFLLTRRYGAVILNKENVPVSAPEDRLKPYRAPVDSTFNYIEQLLDEAIRSNDLPPVLLDLGQNYGRITQTIAYAVKAQVALYRASPEFNGNDLYKNYLNKKGESILYTAYNPALWDSAAAAAKQAIVYAERNRFQLLNTFSAPASSGGIGDTLTRRMIIRNSFSYGGDEKNPEIIWPYTGGNQQLLQRMCLIPGIGTGGTSGGANLPLFNAGVPLHIAEMFYTSHGLPLQEDKTRDYNNRFQLGTGSEESRFNITEGYKTARLNFGREQRYYADLAFDGSVWYGNGHYLGGADNYHVEMKYQQAAGISQKSTFTNPGTFEKGSETGYLVKKWLNWRTEVSSNSWTPHYYTWPIIRLGELYLWYAEAENEAHGPGPEVYEYLNKVRERAGIPDVQTAWDTWSKDPGKYQTKEGLREIIRRELLIETAFEGKRFWDTRRWLTAQAEMNEPVKGFAIFQSTAQKYYRPVVLFNQSFFTLKNYLWPFSIDALSTNPKLQQNPGW